jgi:hypothetical protein
LVKNSKERKKGNHSGFQLLITLILNRCRRKASEELNSRC